LPRAGVAWRWREFDVGYTAGAAALELYDEAGGYALTDRGERGAVQATTLG
jgi:hypothetical protein